MWMGRRVAGVGEGVVEGKERDDMESECMDGKDCCWNGRSS